MLRQEIEKNFQEAVKEKKEGEVSTLRMLKSAILERERKKRYKLTQEGEEKEVILSDEEVIQIVMSEIKKRRESLALFRKGKRDDLISQTEKEIEILERYLPEQASPEEIRTLAREIIRKTGAEEMKDMGRVMSQLMGRLKGKAEGRLVSEIVKELLSK